MAVLTVNTPKSSIETVISKTPLNGGPHTFTYAGGNQFLSVSNKDVVDVTLSIVGASVATIVCPGYGDIDVSGGYSFVIAAGTEERLLLTGVSAFLGAKGNTITATVTGATVLTTGWIEQY